MLDGERLLGADRLPTRGRKGSADSLRGAAALVRRMERRLGATAGEARIAPLRAVGTATLTIPAAVPDTGRLRVLAAGVATPGGAGTCVGAPLWLERRGWRRRAGGGRAAGWPPRAGLGRGGPEPRGSRWSPPAPATPRRRGGSASCSRPGSAVGAVLAGSDEGVLIANRLGAGSPSSTRSTWPRPPPAPCWPSRCAAPGSR